VLVCPHFRVTSSDWQYGQMPVSDVLRAQMRRPLGYSAGLVSRLSGVPKATIVNWLNGRVARPRRWQDLARVADAMRLGRDELDDLLSAANHLFGPRTGSQSR